MMMMIIIIIIITVIIIIIIIIIINNTCPHQYTKLNRIFYNFTISSQPFDAGIKYMVSSGRSADVLITICHPIYVRCTCEIKSRIAMAKAAFDKKIVLFTSTLDLKLRKKLVKCYIWSIALYGVETWTLRAVDQKNLKYGAGEG